MIFGNINYKKTYYKLDEDLVRCLEYAKDNDLMKYKKGTYKIDGENLFVNIVEYETCERADRFWEAHRKYLDIHLMIDGSEIIDLSFIDNLKQKEYQEEDDFLPLAGDQSGYIELRKGDFLVCYPEDAHRTAIKINKKENIKKAIFKVIIR